MVQRPGGPEHATSKHAAGLIATDQADHTEKQRGLARFSLSSDQHFDK
jgi:hypothetical protein